MHCHVSVGSRVHEWHFTSVKQGAAPTHSIVRERMAGRAVSPRGRLPTRLQLRPGHATDRPTPEAPSADKVRGQRQQSRKQRQGPTPSSVRKWMAGRAVSRHDRLACTCAALARAPDRPLRPPVQVPRQRRRSALREAAFRTPYPRSRCQRARASSWTSGTATRTSSAEDTHLTYLSIRRYSSG